MGNLSLKSLKPFIPLEAPDRYAALEQYRARAGVYDLEIALAEPIRRRAIDRLGLRRGATVIDVGCGTGLSFALLQERVGGSGRIIGIEQSPEMFAQAQRRAEQNRWENVTLLRSPVEDAAIPIDADAALFHFTHDILRTPQAVANVVGHLKPGARIVSAGLKWAPVWAMPVNLFVWPAALRSVTSLEGLGEPWSHLARLVPVHNLETLLGGGVYIFDAVSSADETRPEPRGLN